MTDQPSSPWRREILPDISILRGPRRFLRWLFSWRGVRRMLILLAWMLTIVALLYGEENWRGRRAWNAYRAQLEARGEVLNFAAFIPKPVADDQNFAATPFFQHLFANRTNSSPLDSDDFAKVSDHVSSNAQRDEGVRHF